MVISRTPFRVSFLGGGTDFPQWYLENGGEVLGTTISQYCHITLRYLPPFFKYRHRIVYSETEMVNQISEIKHPAVRAVLQWIGNGHGFEIHHDGDLPAKSGLGSSSSFSVGLINAVCALQGKYIGRGGLAFRAHEIEQKVLKEAVGSQDQILASYGGFNRIEFNRDGSFDVSPFILPAERLQFIEKHLMLIFTGLSRIANDVEKDKLDHIREKTSILKEIQSMVKDGARCLGNASGTMQEFGRLLSHYWELKKQLSDRVSNQYIDALYERIIKRGAFGAKLLGAGNGGFLLVCAEPDVQKLILNELSLEDVVHVPFKFDNTGSRIVLYEPNAAG